MQSCTDRVQVTMLNNLEAGTSSKGTPGIYEVSGTYFYSIFQLNPILFPLAFLSRFSPAFLFSNSSIQPCVSSGANIAKIWSSMSTVVELRTGI